jgi:inhibitor of the pro-sigma K processing machinery
MMIKNMDAKSIIIYIAIIVGLFFLAMALKFKKSIAFKIVFRFLIGAVFIYVLNMGVGLLGNMVKVDLTIPLNPVTAAAIGYLQVPGIVLVYLIKYIIYPVI